MEEIKVKVGSQEGKKTKKTVWKGRSFLSKIAEGAVSRILSPGDAANLKNRVKTKL